jgi:SpoVK/Ycf46/Vps4 family AAA+-type ATPase
MRTDLQTRAMIEPSPPPGSKGILKLCVLPDPTWSDYWEGIIVPAAVKNRLLNYALFALTQRAGRSQVALPLHGLLLLQGPPGTGKTTLARGLANEVAKLLAERGGETLFGEVDAHSLPSELLGESQRGIGKLLSRTLPDLSKQASAFVVLLDEVESIAVSRSKTSLETNPVDVHRATDAVLTGLDSLSTEHPNVLVIATSNFPEGIDTAFISRADLVEEFGLPGPEVMRDILLDTMHELGVDTGGRGGADNGSLTELLSLISGLDPRQLRKLVLEGVISRRELVAEPERLGWGDLVAVLRDRG